MNEVKFDKANEPGFDPANSCWYQRNDSRTSKLATSFAHPAAPRLMRIRLHFRRFPPTIRLLFFAGQRRQFG